MKVILREEVENLGDMGDLVEVANGYGRNFLIPQGLAVQATNRNVKAMEHEKRLQAQRLRSSKARPKSSPPGWRSCPCVSRKKSEKATVCSDR